jgi:hypothetical protein
MTTTSGKVPRARYVQGVILLCLTALMSGEAMAGSCTKTSRDLDIVQQSTTISVNAHTVVRNDTSGTSYEVAIFQEPNGTQSGTLPGGGSLTMTSTGGSKKKSGTVSAQGDQVEKMLQAVDDTFTVSITPAGGGAASATICSYQVAAKSKKTTWDLGPSTTVSCTGPLKVSCDKSYHAGKARWNTTFVIEK